MSEPRTVLEHLIDGREALVLEVQRLTTAIEELDSVIGRLGGSPEPLTSGAAPAKTSGQTVNALAELDSGPRAATTGRTRARKRTSARKAKRTTPARKQSGAPKSIRVHVLDMLAAEERELGLAEIIDRVHSAGIQAHDDAVRSITIKLMKDGKVERVRRGQYRLARDGVAAIDTAPSTAPAVPSAPDIAPDSEVAQPASAVESHLQTPAAPQQASATGYTPPLNLGQPWEHRA
jgi:hypothetical protein